MSPYQLYREDGSIDIAPEVLSIPAVRRLAEHHDEGNLLRSWLRILIRVHMPRSVIPTDWSMERRIKEAMDIEKRDHPTLKGSWTRVNHELWQPAVDALLEYYQDDDLDVLKGYEDKIKELSQLIRSTPIRESVTKMTLKKGNKKEGTEDQAIPSTIEVDNTKLHEGWAKLLKQYQQNHHELKGRIWPKLRGGSDRPSTLGDAPKHFR